MRRGISAEYVRFKTGRNRSDCRTGCVSLAPSLEAAVIASAFFTRKYRFPVFKKENEETPGGVERKEAMPANH